MEANKNLGNVGSYVEDRFVYCDVHIPEDQCLSLGAQLLGCGARTVEFCSVVSVMDHLYDKQSVISIQRVWHSFWTIVVTLVAIALARMASWLCTCTERSRVLRFLIEFLVITLPSVLSVNIFNDIVEYIVVAMSVLLLLLMWRKQCWRQVQLREFSFGKRPTMFTLARSTICLLTVLCILAVDFGSFPKDFRKTRRYGAGLMDTGIGLFVFSMGIVSRGPRRLSDLRRVLFTFGCLIVCGLTRSIVIVAIDYHQDEHEYGVHLNAFFTLGFTRLLGTVLSAVANTNAQLLLLGLVVLLSHETSLQLGVSEFVMDSNLERTTFLKANREGICSLPGFVGLYILSMCFGQWIQTKPTINFNEMLQKLKFLAIVCCIVWILVVMSIFTIGIARVTCNFGYAAWILAIGFTMLLLFVCVFDMALDTMWPLPSQGLIMSTNIESGDVIGSGVGGGENLIKRSVTGDSSYQEQRITSLINAVNYNGLVFFLLANVLTGGVNIFLKPENRSDFESVLILTLYMFVSTGVVYILYLFQIRIA